MKTFDFAQMEVEELTTQEMTENKGGCCNSGGLLNLNSVGLSTNLHEGLSLQGITVIKGFGLNAMANGCGC